MSKTRILVVEDEVIVAQDLKATLEKLGYAVPGVVSTGEDAIDKAGRLRPDLVLMDIVLKGDMDGIQTARHIRKGLEIPVVYLTAYADDATLERAKITEPFGYLIKPFEERELRTSIEMALYKHRMEKKLVASHRWLATTLRSIGDGVIATDADANVVFMNPVAEELVGWKEEQALGKPLEEVFRIVNEHTLAPAENPVEKALREGAVVGLANHTILIARHGAQRSIADSAAPIQDNDNSIHGVVLVFRDVTEKLRLEEDVRKAQKLESVGILAGGIAHDFNNILTSILGNVGLAKLAVEPAGRVYARLKAVETAVERAGDLTHQLLTFAKGGAPTRKVASLARLLQDAVALAMSGSNAACQVHMDEDLWSVDADQGQMSQVFNNLIINASQAMPEGGLIDIRAANETVVPGHHSGLPEGRYACVAVSDQGVGIASKHLGSIFDPYFTTKQKGSGLGLAVSYSIVKRHDGQITVESQLGAGSTFRVYLPASGQELPVETVAEQEPIPGEGKILVMDDDEQIRELVGQLLPEIGYQVQFAQDGAKAIEQYQEAAQAGQPFDAVVLDLTIPGGVGGREALAGLLELNPDVKAIVSSGYSNDPILADPAHYGFSAALVKPYKIGVLSQLLHDILTD